MNPIRAAAGIMAQGVRLKAQSFVCHWAIHALYGPSPADQGLATRQQFWHRRAKNRAIIPVAINPSSEDGGGGPDLDRLLLYPIMHDLNLALLARFTEEYREGHDAAAPCGERLGNAATAPAILEHFAACAPDHDLPDLPGTLEWLKDWEAALMMRTLRKQFPALFPEGSPLAICRDLSTAEQQALEAVAKAAGREVQYLEDPGHPAADEEKEADEEEPVKSPRVKTIRIRLPSIRGMLLATVGGTLLFQLWGLFSSRTTPLPAPRGRPAESEGSLPDRGWSGRAPRSEPEEPPTPASLGPRPLHPGPPSPSASFDAPAAGMPKPLHAH